MRTLKLRFDQREFLGVNFTKEFSFANDMHSAWLSLDFHITSTTSILKVSCSTLCETFLCHFSLFDANKLFFTLSLSKVTELFFLLRNTCEFFPLITFCSVAVFKLVLIDTVKRFHHANLFRQNYHLFYRVIKLFALWKFTLHHFLAPFLRSLLWQCMRIFLILLFSNFLSLCSSN